MSMDLAELGRVICQDFDDRVPEINAIRSEINEKLKNDWNELKKLADNNSAKLQAAGEQIRNDTIALLVNFREENKTMLNGLIDNSFKNSEELKAWAQEQGEDLKGWYEAGAYLQRKCTGR